MEIVITTNLHGALKGAQRHTTYQTNSISIGNGKNRLTFTKDILHTDRVEMECVRKTTINSEVMNKWLKGDCPSWEKPKHWKQLSENQKIRSYVKTFDEGFGVSFEICSR